MINRVVLVGRLTRDPELRRTGNGHAVTSFTIALNRNYTVQEGQPQADYISCVVWNKGAENTAQYCSKGSLVGIEGRLQSRSYDDKDGKRVYVTEVVCDRVQFLDNRNGQQQTQATQEQPVQQTQAVQQPQPQPQPQEVDDMFAGQQNFNIMEDDIQF